MLMSRKAESQQTKRLATRSAIKRSKWMLLMLIFVIVFAGCSGNNGGNVADNNLDTSSSSNQNDATENTAVEEVEYPESISYWVSLHPSVTATMSSLNGVAVYEELERFTGTKVDMRHPSGSTGAEVL